MLFCHCVTYYCTCRFAMSCTIYDYRQLLKCGTIYSTIEYYSLQKNSFLYLINKGYLENINNTVFHLFLLFFLPALDPILLRPPALRDLTTSHYH